MKTNKKLIWIAAVMVLILLSSAVFICFAAGAFDSSEKDCDTDSAEEKKVKKDAADEWLMPLCPSEIAFERDNPDTWYSAAQNGGIQDEQADSVEVGMTFTEVVAILGRPQRDIGSGAILAEWDMQSGKKLIVCFNPSGSDADAAISYHTFIKG